MDFNVKSISMLVMSTSLMITNKHQMFGVIMVVPAKTVQVLIIIVFVDLALLGQIAKRKSMPVIHHLVLTEDNVRIMDNSISNVIVHMDGRVKHVNSRFINAMIRINVRIMVYA